MSEPSEGLVRALLLDDSGGGRTVGWEEVRSWRPGDGLLWVHLDRTSDDSRRWIEAQDDLPESIRHALSREGSRPRVGSSEHGTLLILRGINHNPGRDSSDMVSLRLFADERRIVSLEGENMRVPQAVAKHLLACRTRPTTGGIMVQLVRATTECIAPVIVEIEERMEELEEHALKSTERELRDKLADLRRDTIALRRYLGPQGEAMHELSKVPAPPLDKSDRLHVQEQADRMRRLLEDLGAMRERAILLNEEIGNHLTEQINRRMYVLAIVTVVFLPLSLITGLLGINVAGIPGARDPRGFLVVCGGIVVIAIGLMGLLRRRGWM